MMMGRGELSLKILNFHFPSSGKFCLFYRSVLCKTEKSPCLASGNCVGKAGKFFLLLFYRLSKYFVKLVDEIFC